MYITDITDVQNDAALWAKGLEKRDRTICEKELSVVFENDRDANPWDALVRIRNDWDRIQKRYLTPKKGKRGV